MKFALVANKDVRAGRYLPPPSLTDRRSLLTKMLLAESEKLLVEHSSSTRQGVWTHWSAVRPFDFSWHNLLRGWTQIAQLFVLQTCSSFGDTNPLLNAPFVPLQNVPFITSWWVVKLHWIKEDTPGGTIQFFATSNLPLKDY